MFHFIMARMTGRRTMSKMESNILLFSITLCWAASYIFIKNLPENFSSYAYLALTTGIAAAIMAVIFWKQLKTALSTFYQDCKLQRQHRQHISPLNPTQQSVWPFTCSTCFMLSVAAGEHCCYNVNQEFPLGTTNSHH